jgi:(p)ppGpp synthase/HD superfamily hydrolase
MIFKMIKFAEEKHKGQVRKGSGEPYITHPIAVSYLVASYKRSKKIKELITACHGHDLLEDTDTTFDELVTMFGPLVASLIFELTNDEEELKRVGKFEYHKKKLSGMSNYGLVIKLCDRLHNVSDNPKSVYLMDTIMLIDYLQKQRKLTGTQQQIASEIYKICDNKLRILRREEHEKAWAEA